MTSTSSARPGIARSLNCDGAYGIALGVGVLVLLAPLAGGFALRDLWRYERIGVAAGQWWRLLTAHLVHLDATHALLNAVGLALLWALFARAYRLGQWALAAASSVLAIDLGLWFLSTQVSWYVGASGLLHGVFACGCIALLRQRDRVALVAAAIFVAKLAWEQLVGPLPFESGQPVVTVSHAYGAIGGALAGLLLRPRSESL